MEWKQTGQSRLREGQIRVVLFKQGAECLWSPVLCYHQPGEEREKPARALERQLSLRLGDPQEASEEAEMVRPSFELAGVVQSCFQRNLVNQGFQVSSRRRNLCWGHRSSFLFPASLLPCCPPPKGVWGPTHKTVKLPRASKALGIGSWEAGFRWKRGWTQHTRLFTSGYRSGSKNNKKVFKKGHLITLAIPSFENLWQPPLLSSQKATPPQKSLLQRMVTAKSKLPISSYTSHTEVSERYCQNIFYDDWQLACMPRERNL